MFNRQNILGKRKLNDFGSFNNLNLNQKKDKKNKHLNIIYLPNKKKYRFNNKEINDDNNNNNCNMKTSDNNIKCNSFNMKCDNNENEDFDLNNT